MNTDPRLCLHEAAYLTGHSLSLGVDGGEAEIEIVCPDCGGEWGAESRPVFFEWGGTNDG